ncbi:MAG TPA: hypothetical protein VK780_10280, partial [Thermoanaerobaculia bacterium]|nr:hypothetical protein [Thermoanaerobaculia bacterium]
MDVADAPARSGYAKRIAFLAQASDPSRGAPRPVQREIREVCRVAQFGGRDKEVAADGGWTLVGLGARPVPLWKLRRAARKALRETLRHVKGRVLLVFGDAVDAATLRALLPQIVASDYAFDRYKSRGSPP